MHTKPQTDQANMVKAAFQKTGAYESDYRLRQVGFRNFSRLKLCIKHQMNRYHGRLKWVVAAVGVASYALMLQQKQKAIYEGTYGNTN